MRAQISVLERQHLAAVTSDVDSHFVIDGLEEGTDATLFFEHRDYRKGRLRRCDWVVAGGILSRSSR